MEAEDFIYHVRQKVLAEGKLRDKQWILDFVSTCFIRDALRWYASLDTATQDDWPLLQKALLARFRPVFRGFDGEECENFVAQLYRSALNEGKARDGDWLVEHAIASFVGDALRWYAELEPEVQTTWTLLQKAMFQRWPAPDVREKYTSRRTPSHTVPIPAAAVVPSTTAQWRKGLIRVDSDRLLSGVTYAKLLLRRTVMSYAHRISERRCKSNMLRPRLRMRLRSCCDKNSAAGWKSLGIRWNTVNPNPNASVYDHGVLMGIAGDSPNALTTSWATGVGPICSQIWNIASDGKISFAWVDSNGDTRSLLARINTADNALFLAGSRSRHDEQSDQLIKVQLVFEPM